MEVLRLAKLQQQTYMEDTVEDRIPIEFSTPKLLFFFGRQVENEIRRNSISLASSFKRKISPQGDKTSTRRVRYNSSNNLLQDEARNPLNNYAEHTKTEDNQDPLRGDLSEDHNHLGEHSKKDDQMPPEDSGGQE